LIEFPPLGDKLGETLVAKRIVGYRPRPEVAPEVIRYLEGWTPPGWKAAGAGSAVPRNRENGIANVAPAGFETTPTKPRLMFS